VARPIRRRARAADDAPLAGGQDVESLILLIDDPRHRINEDGTYNLSEEQARAILALQLSRLTRSAATRSPTS
jgi:DNA gyrase/topoisomerase IV subunit A